MQTLAQFITDVVFLPFHLTLFFVMAPFRMANWGAKTVRRIVSSALDLTPELKSLLLAERDRIANIVATRNAAKSQPKSQKSEPKSEKSLPTLASVSPKKRSDKATQSATEPSSVYDDFLEGLRRSIQSAKDPKAQVQVLKEMLNSSQDTAMEAANVASKQKKDIDGMEKSYAELSKTYSELSFQMHDSTEKTAKLEKQLHMLQAEQADKDGETRQLYSQIARLQNELKHEKNAHLTEKKRDRIAQLNLERQLIKERVEFAEIKEKLQVANLELVELSVREEEKIRDMLHDQEKDAEIQRLREEIHQEEKLQKKLRKSISQEASNDQVPQEEIKEGAAGEAGSATSEPAKPHHEFDPTHLSFKDALLEVAPHEPHHHEFDPSHFSYKNALLEPTENEPMDSSSNAMPEAQSSY